MLETNFLQIVSKEWKSDIPKIIYSNLLGSITTEHLSADKIVLNTWNNFWSPVLVGVGRGHVEGEGVVLE